VIVKAGAVIGQGYNAPPGDNLKERICQQPINKYAKYPADKTCCVHAEQRAIMAALRDHPHKLAGADLHYVAIDDQGQVEYAGKPYCTHCSKLALDVGIKRFGLWHRQGIKMYDTLEYNRLSYRYRKRA
jgi:deoxycytidylate deaminase